MTTNPAPIRVAIVEDHADFRDGLRLMLSSSQRLTIVGAFPSVEASMRDFPECDVLLLDINLPGRSGIESIPVYKRQSAAMQIVMLTGLDDDESIFNAILAGADGYLLKKTPPARVLAAVEDAAEGGTPMTPYVARRVIEHFKSTSPAKTEYQLSDREREILSALVKGLDNRQIADTLFISYETVRNHLKHIYEKLHVNSRTQAVSKAITERIV
ncbi:MAG: response regulator transcription factor [Bacteroidetes bacterium]|nr:response regulator transcription factor [Bacteroidota bacterium]